MTTTRRNPCIIYAVADPRLPSVIRYIGKTVHKLKHRLGQHKAGIERYPSRRSSWIKGIQSQGVEPIIWPLEICSDENWQEREKFWIRFFKPIGLLTNHYEGGNGVHKMPTRKSETRLKISLAKRGKKWTLRQKLGRLKFQATAVRTVRQQEQFRKMLATRNIKSEAFLENTNRLHSLPKTEKALRQFASIRNLGNLANRHPVECLDTAERFPSLAEAGRHNNTSGAKILSSIQRNGRCKGLRWRKIKKENTNVSYD